MEKIVVVTKKFKYEKRELPSQIALPTFVNYFNYIYNIEHKIALKNNTVEKHLKCLCTEICLSYFIG